MDIGLVEKTTQESKVWVRLIPRIDHPGSHNTSKAKSFMRRGPQQLNLKPQ